MFRFKYLALVALVILILVFLTAQLMAGGEMIFLPLIIQPRTFEAIPSAAAFNRITDIAHASDGRLFITEQLGTIRVVQPSGEVSMFLDLRDRVILEEAEQGLFSIAFHPNYAQNGYFFVSYIGTVWDDGDRWLFVSRFKVSDDPNVADPASRERILVIKQEFNFHNGGGMAFNPLDGYLYLGVGDDGQLLVAQDMQGYKGKILRINVDTMLAEEPAAMMTQTEADVWSLVPIQVWAAGFRNPWRFGIDPIQGHIYVGDVGDRDWEEVNFIPFGAQNMNFGWPCLEGPTVLSDIGECDDPSDFVQPVHYYPHGVGGCLVIGGEVYRPPTEPQANGRFLFADGCTHKIFSLTNMNGSWQVEHLGTISEATEILTTFGIDNEGTVYVGTYMSPGPFYELYIP